MAYETFSIDSSDGRSIRCYRWLPEGNVKATVQIVHGMLESAVRYDDTAGYFTERGYAVYAHDHMGHGPVPTEDFGYFGDEGGDERLVNDTINLSEHIEDSFPEIRHFIVGHSMGSYITRLAVTKHHYDGALAVATGNRSKDSASKMVAFADSVVKDKGPRSHSEELDEMVLGKGFSRVKSQPSHNIPEERRDRLRFRSAGYRDMFMLSKRLAFEEGFGSIDTKILFVSGGKDVVGDMGKGPKEAADILRRYGNDPKVMMFWEKGHDILHEEGKEEVYGCIEKWMSSFM